MDVFRSLIFYTFAMPCVSFYIFFFCNAERPQGTVDSSILMKAKYVLWLNSKVIDSFFGRILLSKSLVLLQLLWARSSGTTQTKPNRKEKKLNPKIFIVLWHIVQCRQKHVNWCGPPIWFRNKVSRRWVNKSECERI